ncbi:ABC transporter substrate-binding protein [Fuchsiella alkaliacetigena]|uniref:ABC transporter substrate-binding protein n=1 Tax=Fuchsiella alkaliacetigena TaxID=957042 RepID=UPI00200A4941|nr:ABC transporter substrate-binding protein [Fuchsiella alkaliacetigena]MCK8824629.1 ABC transporter substrate-binding protein [Fuchsiella alkaliacetigena]
MKKSLSIILVVVLVVGMGAFLSGCGQETEVEIVRIGDENGDWGYPTPHGHYLRGPGYLRMSFIFDTLIWKDENGFVSALAEDWEYDEEENCFIFELRDDVRWHDGEDFTAQDVAFTFDYLQKHPYPWANLDSVEKVELIDDYQVKVYLSQAHAPFLERVAGVMPILPEHIWAEVEEPAEFTGEEAVVGTGPYELLEYDQTQGSYHYAANQNYYGGEPIAEELMFVESSNPEMALQRGNINAAGVMAEAIPELEQQGFELITGNHFWAAKLMMNQHQEPFDQRKFRQALAYAIDREELVERGLRGYGIAGSQGLIAPESRWAAEDLPEYAYSPEKAKELIEELGYTMEDGIYTKGDQRLEFTLLSFEDRIPEIIKQNLAKVGIEIELRVLDTASLDARVDDWDFDLAMSGHGALGGDPMVLNQMILDDDPKSVRFEENQDLLDKLNQQLRIMDEDKRLEMVKEIQSIYAEEMPAVTLYYPEDYWAIDDTIDWFYTEGGVAIGIPLPLNKLSLIERDIN